ncbi:N-acetylmuramoyl-L-alanine amidase [Luteolibacter pohnpeiensis]|uniref:N-acetylmuramoyl-L-alanine amidase n=1 Tax=Luteolibacter pohnpeiensis TaxID=454153 RepID=A0A934S901_9BACT|nr:N-acetylmuramoyl-L-alanine amidase [Luteolibacter pohnpeiensis]MBK1881574.1 N-acetylmuramoyl-L-alanine amidase [Luteolibacter pohnpeiensis]
MPPRFRRYLPLYLAGVIATVILIWIIFRPSTSPLPPKPPQLPPIQELPPPELSILAKPPDWSQLNQFRDCISRNDFETLLSEVFTTSDSWKKFIQLEENSVEIAVDDFQPHGKITIPFADPAAVEKPTRFWRAATDLAPYPDGKPLDGLKIAIDPGHIGGDWAKMEERWFVLGTGTPVMEGNMTLTVAKLAKPLLEQLGAKVTLVRDKTEPVTSLRPEALMELARKSSPDAGPEEIRKIAERLFYRTAEIRARADLVNDTIKPDLVLCLHFNADAWGNPNQPTLTDHSHFHVLVNGAYNSDEVALADQRYAMLHKIFQGIHREETLVGTTVASVFAERTGLPAYHYSADSPNVRQVGQNPYLWARNLLANRLYDCPVIFLEPYVMNSIHDYARIQAGDYEGMREVDGKQQASIFHEYATALVEGLSKHYAATRTPQ